MKLIVGTCLTLCLLAGTSAVQSQSSVASGKLSEDGGTPLTTLIETVAKKTGKKFILDPRVRAQATLIGQDPASVDYSELLSILKLSGFAAVQAGDYVEVIPDAVLRQMATPLVTGKENLPEAEFVNAVIHVKNVPAVQLVPILRPLLPQYAHFATIPCTNTIIMSDTFGNVRRLEAIIQALDVGEPYKPETCAMMSSAAREAAAKHDGPPAANDK